MRFTAIVFGTLIGVLPIAADAQDASTPAIMHTTVQECLNMVSALVALDGHPALNDKGEPIMVPSDGVHPAHPVIVPYKFAPGVVQKLAHDETLLASFDREIQETKHNIMAKLAPGKAEVKQGDLEYEAVFKAANDMMLKPCRIEFEKISEKALRPDENHLPPSVVAMLAPLIEITTTEKK